MNARRKAGPPFRLDKEKNMGYNNVVADMQKRFSSTAKNAGVLELADEADSKSTTPIHTTLAQTLDFTGVFEN